MLAKKSLCRSIPILEKRTIVYGFFIDNEIKFAVEIKNNKIVQSKSKYNQDLQIRETSLVMGWFTEYFEEKNPMKKNIILIPKGL